MSVGEPGRPHPGSPWHLLQVGPRTGSPMTWLSTCRVRLMPTMPKTTKTMAPVSTSGRTAGFPQPVFTQGLKPKVADRRALGPAGESPLQWRWLAPSPPAPLPPPQCTFLAGHVEEAFGGPVGAGAEQAAGRGGAHAPVEGRLVGLREVQLPVGAREAGLRWGGQGPGGGGAGGATCRGQKSVGDGRPPACPAQGSGSAGSFFASPCQCPPTV